MTLPTQIWKNWVFSFHLHPVLKATVPSPTEPPYPCDSNLGPLIISFIITVGLIVINIVLLLLNSQGEKRKGPRLPKGRGP